MQIGSKRYSNVLFYRFTIHVFAGIFHSQIERASPQNEEPAMSQKMSMFPNSSTK